MTTSIRRYRRHRLAPLFLTVTAIILLAALVAWVILLLWAKGGPQPLHEIVVVLPAPKIAGPRA